MLPRQIEGEACGCRFNMERDWLSGEIKATLTEPARPLEIRNATSHCQSSCILGTIYHVKNTATRC